MRGLTALVLSVLGFVIALSGLAGNDAQHAIPIEPGTSYQGSLKYPDYYDCYSFEANAGQIISVSLIGTCDVKDYEFEVTLYDPNGERCKYGYTEQGTGKVEYVAGRTGTWIVEIEGRGNYTLRVDVINQNDAGSGGDAGDDKEHATLIELGKSYQGYVMPTDNNDYYSFDVTDGKTIIVEVASDGMVEVYLYGPKGRLWMNGNTLPDRPVRFGFTTESAGTWFIDCRPYGGGNYTLALSYQDIAPRFTCSPGKVYASQRVILDASSSSVKFGEIKAYEWLITNDELDYSVSRTGPKVEWTPPCWGRRLQC